MTAAINIAFFMFNLSFAKVVGETGVFRFYSSAESAMLQAVL